MPSVIGLDLSLTSTGLSCGDTILAIKSKKRSEPRLIEIRDRIVAEIQQIPDPVVLLEGFSMGSRNSQAHAIGGLGWIVRVALYEAGIPWTEMAPTARAKFATGKGNASKSQVVSAVSARTSIVFDTDDEVDAWVLEEAGRVFLNQGRYEWPKVNCESLLKIDFLPWGV